MRSSARSMRATRDMPSTIAVDTGLDAKGGHVQVLPSDRVDHWPIYGTPTGCHQSYIRDQCR